MTTRPTLILRRLADWLLDRANRIDGHTTVKVISPRPRDEIAFGEAAARAVLDSDEALAVAQASLRHPSTQGTPLTPIERTESEALLRRAFTEPS